MPRPDRPNVIVITTHDSGRYFGCYGLDTVHTPAVDAIAADGVMLSRMFATVPICSASRASMMTGRYPQSHGLLDLCGPAFRWALGPDERHLSHILRDAGYRTLQFGFQHEAWDVSTLGFDDVRRESSRADDVAKMVSAFLREEASGEAPFYAQVGFLETHTPFRRDWVEPDREKGVYVPPYLVRDEESEETMAWFQGMVRVADRAVGTIVEALARSGLEDDTLLVFTTDHGIELPRSKWFLYDPGIEIAMVFRWPGGGISGGRACDCLLGNVDFLPTVLELIGAPVPENVEGLSFARNLTDGTASGPRDEVFGLYHKMSIRSIRTDRYKLIQHFDSPIDFLHLPVALETQLEKRGIGPVELFDLQEDPVEFHDLSTSPEHAGIRDGLRGRLWRWLESVNDPILQGPIASPVYLSARDDYRAWRDAAEGTREETGNA